MQAHVVGVPVSLDPADLDAGPQQRPGEAPRRGRCPQPRQPATPGAAPTTGTLPRCPARRRGCAAGGTGRTRGGRPRAWGRSRVHPRGRRSTFSKCRSVCSSTSGTSPAEQLTRQSLRARDDAPGHGRAPASARGVVPGTRAGAGPAVAPPPGAARAARRPPRTPRRPTPSLRSESASSRSSSTSPSDGRAATSRTAPDAGPRAQRQRLVLALGVRPGDLQRQRLAVTHHRDDDGRPAGARRTVDDQAPPVERLVEASRHRGHPRGAGRPAVRRVGRDPRHPVGREGDRAHSSAGNGSSSSPSGGPAPRPSRATGSPPPARPRSRMPRARRGARRTPRAG